ncbi:MAG: HAD family hydrolase [Caldilineae bacterium]|nr:MAG: HAD family hydrolase [Caldilineae bacterium]
MPAARIEVIRPRPAALPRLALFDFDGTLSLLRAGWQAVMLDWMVEHLRRAPRAEGETALRAQAAEAIHRLTGQPTLRQMRWLCEAIRERGGAPESPERYKQIYLRRLEAHIAGRIAGVEEGRVPPEAWLVPGAPAILRALRARGIPCYIASGTDETAVRREASVLGIAGFFGGIFGARPADPAFDKGAVIARLTAAHRLRPGELVAFGDGGVEIAAARAAGGIAVGVALDETTRAGLDAGKRRRLIEAGAHLIIPHFQPHDALLAWLFGERGVPG